MLQPVRTKYRKAFKGRIHGNATRAVKLNYGQFGLKAIQRCCTNIIIKHNMTILKTK